MQLMTPGSPAEHAFVLQSGSMTVKFDLPDLPTLTYEGKGRVMGAIEAIVAFRDKIPLSYAMNVVASQDAAVTRVEPAKLMALMQRVPVSGFKICRDIAEIAIALGDARKARASRLGKEVRRHREYCKLLARTVDSLNDEYAKRKLPWLEPVAKQFGHTLEYQEGQSYIKGEHQPPMDIPSDKLNAFSRQFPPGSYLCKQGELGEEMFILQSGKLIVEVDNVEVNSIVDVGTVFGELSVLLHKSKKDNGEETHEDEAHPAGRRTASLKATIPTVVTVIHQTDLVDVAKQQEEFWASVAYSMAQRVLHALAGIRELDDALSKQAEEDSRPAALRSDNAKDLAKDMSQNLKELVQKHDMEWLAELSSQVAKDYSKIRSM